MSFYEKLKAEIKTAETAEDKERIKVLNRWMQPLERKIYEYERERALLIASFGTNIRRYIKKAVKLSKDIRVTSRKRKKFKIIVNRFQGSFTEDQALNLYIILRKELKAPFKK